jgi:DNA-binding winged helix-turn-helix (wHTH) protein
MPIRFGEFVIDGGTRQVTRGGVALPLSPKAIQLLEVLIVARPRVVPKAEVIDALWPDVAVEEANVRNLVAELRRALADDDAAPRYIRTAHRHGYAFIADAWAQQRQRIPRLHDATLLYPLRDGENVLGRHESCDVRLAASGVSRRHARIYVSETDEVLADLGSKNGTWLNAQRIEQPSPLQDGDQIKIGIVVLTFRTAVDESTITVK